MEERKSGNRLKDLSGLKFGTLEVLKRDYSITGKCAKWLCKCACGSITSIRGTELHNRLRCRYCSSATRRKDDAVHKHPMYGIFYAMHTRCSNQNHPSYKRYGARGIAVCPEWDSFEQFCLDMGTRPEGASIERTNNELGYGPDNCVWASMKTQGNNRSSNTLLTINGVTKTKTEWSEESGVSPELIYYRLKRGWSAEEAVFTPAGERRKK